MTHLNLFKYQDIIVESQYVTVWAKWTTLIFSFETLYNENEQSYVSPTVWRILSLD